MNTDITTMIAEFAKANKISKVKTAEFVEQVLATKVKAPRVKKERVVRPERVKKERVIDRIWSMASDFKTFNVSEAAEATGSTWIASYQAIRQLAREGKIKEACKKESGKPGKKSVIWTIA